ncbi:MAG: GYD domain-containing protein [Chloroflexota bacterium]
MPKFVALFSVESAALSRLIEHPEDRKGAVGKLVEVAGGKLLEYFWMFGQYDGMVIMEVPDSKTAAAIILAVASTGAFKHLETHELIDSGDLVAIADKAQALRGSYRAPGA